MDVSDDEYSLNPRSSGNESYNNPIRKCRDNFHSKLSETDINPTGGDYQHKKRELFDYSRDECKQSSPCCSNISRVHDDSPPPEKKRNLFDSNAQQNLNIHQNDPDHASQVPLLTYKQFIQQQDDNISEKDAIKKYNEYKIELEQKWHSRPDGNVKYQEKQAKNVVQRLEVFLDLRQKGWLNNLSLDLDKSEEIIRYLDACGIRLKGGTNEEIKRLLDTNVKSGINKDDRIRVASSCLTHLKSVVKNDIKLAMEIIQNMDKIWGIWQEKSKNSEIKEFNEDKSEKIDVKDPGFEPISIHKIYIRDNFSGSNPLFKNITHYLADKDNTEESKLLSDEVNKTQVDRDMEIDQDYLMVLDKLILYLRVVYSIDFYNSFQYQHEDSMSKYLGILFVRPSLQNSKLQQFKKDEVDEYIKIFNSKMKQFTEFNNKFVVASSTSVSKSPVTSPAKKKTQAGKAVKTFETAIGVFEFRQLVEESTIFIDKSLLIKEFLKNKAKVLLITCPRRFGKTINMDMIKTFLEIEVDQNGERHSNKKETSNYKLFQGEIINNSKKENLEKPLNIALDQEFSEFYDEYQGEYPVIFVSFLDARGSSYEEIMEGIKVSISLTFTQHLYLIRVLNNIIHNSTSLESPKSVAEHSLNLFKNVQEDRATDKEIKNSLRFLSELLFNHFNKKVFILIDEYDAPLNSATQNNVDVNKINNLMEAILCSTFKNNRNLKKGLMTGISGIARASASSGLNNVVAFKFLDNHFFSKYYGFVEDDVLALLNSSNKTNYDEVRSWYDGYLVRDEISSQHFRIYNPWSILRYIQIGILDDYWEKSGSINNILKIFTIECIRNKVKYLINEFELEFELKTEITLTDLENLQLILNCRHTVPQQHIDLFFSYIFELGYLSYTSQKGSFRIPNLEIKSEFIKNIVDYYLNTYNLDKERLKDAIKQLDILLEIESNEDISGFTLALNKLFEPLSLANINEPEKEGMHPNEDLFHSIINIIAIQSKSKKFGTEVWHKKQSRVDILLTNNERKLGMIVEIKYNGSVIEALNQTKKYLPLFEEYKNIRTIKSLGINISKEKKVTIKIDLKYNRKYTEN
ncbi:unnamed protein product [Brachionus calyciflorus]|uniref:AAA-ATPase-like domain-containing protein n=1 Tax=Brachionus calyciflorus TaxID=104777 RepID=A0A813T8G4_9BILA|nr:unnamed protein product [Brachionus calyciflorus]